MKPDELLEMLTPEWIASADTRQLENIVRQTHTLPKSGFPTIDRLYERTELIDRELRSRHSRQDDTNIERRHREQLEQAQAQLREQIQQHNQAMEQERAQHQESLSESRRQFAISVRSARVAAAIAVVAALAGVASAWYSRVQVLSAARPPMSNTPTSSTSTPKPAEP